MRGSVQRQFCHFVLPAMLTMLLTGFYTIVDGFFVGQATHDVGLAAINLVWPITAVLIALGSGIGCGGSVLLSAYQGANQPDKAIKIKAETIIILIFISILMTLLLVFTCPYLVRFLGAEGMVLEASLAYIRVIALGGSMQIMACGLTPLIRNCQLSIAAMMIMCTGLISNIFLDALFTMVLPWGLGGAALATTLSQGITVVLALYCLLFKTAKMKKTDFILCREDFIQIIKIGISPFGLSFMPNLVTVFFNWQLIRYGGMIALSAYSVSNYFVCCAQMLLGGIGEGLQPLISYYHGAENEQILKLLERKALRFSVLISAVFLAASIGIGYPLALFFNTSHDTAKLVQHALPILSLAYFFIGFNKFYSSYFYARKNPLYSNLLVYLDPLVLSPLSLFVLPLWLKLDGIWFALFSAQLLAAFITLLLLHHPLNQSI